MASGLIVGMEIGTARTVLCAGELDPDRNRVRIVGLQPQPTLGVRKGQVVDSARALDSVNAVLTAMSNEQNITVWKMVQVCSGGNIHAVHKDGVLSINNADHQVTGDDIAEVSEIVQNRCREEGHYLLHVLPQGYQLDEQWVSSPVGMNCNELRMHMLGINAESNRIDNMINVSKSAEIEVTDVVFGGVCAALSVLTDEQKRNGVVLIDLGAGTTDYVAYLDGMVATVGSISVGGDHITNDIAIAFNVTNKRAETLKCEESNALVLPIEKGRERILLRQDLGFEERNINRRSLDTVVNARIDEILRLVRDRLNEDDVLSQFHGSVVLTGGGAYLKGVTELTSQIFARPCSIGIPVNVDGLESVEQPASFATAAGAVIYGFKSYQRPRVGAQMLGFIKKIFGGN
jgi:cell division protein FtsA